MTALTFEQNHGRNRVRKKHGTQELLDCVSSMFDQWQFINLVAGSGEMEIGHGQRSCTFGNLSAQEAIWDAGSHLR
jgi:hypothetical protein